MTKKNHKSGYELLKEKCAKLEAENKELYERISKQETEISKLTADKVNLESDIKFYAANAKNYWNHMGLFRQWLWMRRHG